MHLFGAPSQPCCCGLSANHVNIMQSPLSTAYIHPLSLSSLLHYSTRRQESSPLCWREKAPGCRQERALHIERLCVGLYAQQGFLHTERNFTTILSASFVFSDCALLFPHQGLSSTPVQHLCLFGVAICLIISHHPGS